MMAGPGYEPRTSRPESHSVNQYGTKPGKFNCFNVLVECQLCLCSGVCGVGTVPSMSETVGHLHVRRWTVPCHDELQSTQDAPQSVFTVLCCNLLWYLAQPNYRQL